MRRRRATRIFYTRAWCISGSFVLAVTLGCQRTEPASPASSAFTATAAATSDAPLIPAQPTPAYAGSQSCRECHLAAYGAWRESNHGLAERDLDPEIDAAAFRPHDDIHHGSLISNVGTDDEGPFIETFGEHKQREKFRPARVLGNTPLRQFLIPAERGRYQMAELAYDPRSDDWFGVFGDEDRRPEEWGHWTNRGMTWNAMCADCHNTALHKNYDATDDSYATASAEMGVGCEACHGPSATHVQWQRAYAERVSAGDSHSATESERDPAIERYRELYERRPLMDVCGACHSRRTELREEFTLGDHFSDSFLLALPDETEVWYADGQVHDEDYVFASFRMSRMYNEGVRCMNCHEPHALRTLATGNDLCLRCHVGKIDPAAHSHHDINDSGGQCANCHMPQTTYMQRHARRDHGLTIPDPLLTKQFGIPNACNRCHTDKDVDWALAATEEWYGERMQRNTRERATLIARARREDPGAAADLLAYLQKETHPTWRAILMHLLGAAAEQPAVREAVITALQDETDLVRIAAARATQPSSPRAEAALRSALADPIRGVRVSAAWSLGPLLDINEPAARELREYLEHNSDQPAGVALLATFLREHGRPRDALRRVDVALRWQPDLDVLHYERGMASALLGLYADARDSMKRACELAPTRAAWWFSLGLAHAELAEMDETITALEKAVEVDPRFGRAWYNLGLARRQRNEIDAALTALDSATQAEPRNPDYWFALGTVLRDAGRPREALDAADAALRVDPRHEGARALSHQLQSP